jgi:hypothetical protein
MKVGKPAVAAYLACLMLLASSGAFALDSAISTALTTAFATAVTDATALSALVVVPIVGILALTIVIKLVKRFGNKI